MDMPWWVWAIAAGALIGGAVTFEMHVYAKGYAAGRDKTVAEWNQANDKARKDRDAERDKLQKEKDDALREAAARLVLVRADADRARGVADGLRRDLAASRGAIDTASVASLRQRTATLTDVFEECVRGYSEVARSADGHASDSLMLQRAWPTK